MLPIRFLRGGETDIVLQWILSSHDGRRKDTELNHFFGANLLRFKMSRNRPGDQQKSIIGSVRMKVKWRQGLRPLWTTRWLRSGTKHGKREWIIIVRISLPSIETSAAGKLSASALSSSIPWMIASTFSWFPFASISFLCEISIGRTRSLFKANGSHDHHFRSVFISSRDSALMPTQNIESSIQNFTLYI